MNDDELLKRMRATDPATDLPPADPERVRHLLEDTMTSTQTQTTPTPRTPRTPNRRAVWLASAAAAVLLGGGALAASGVLSGDRGASIAKPTASATPPLQLRGDAKADVLATSCLRLEPELVAQAHYAFDGKVTAITTGAADQPTRVTVQVDRWFTPPGPSTVVVTDASNPDNPRYLPEWKVGTRYLIAADEQGVMQICGPTGEWSTPLDDLFTKAFPAAP